MKPKSYTQLFVQIVFAVKCREALLTDKIRPDVFQYMFGILTELKHKPMIVNGISDHVHLLMGVNSSKSIADTVFSLKRNTSIFINRNKLCPVKFSWQIGYGAFSYSKSQVDRVYNYIKNQEQHHRGRTFREEYMDFLSKVDIPFQEKYLFDFFSDS